MANFVQELVQQRILRNRSRRLTPLASERLASRYSIPGGVSRGALANINTINTLNAPNPINTGLVSERLSSPASPASTSLIPRIASSIVEATNIPVLPLNTQQVNPLPPIKLPTGAEPTPALFPNGRLSDFDLGAPGKRTASQQANLSFLISQYT